MAILRLQCSFMYDTAFPRDRMVITPHFNDADALTSEQELCDDLADALVLWAGATGEVSVKSYDAQGTPPVYPNGEAVRNEGIVDSTNYPRELSLCLSYYSERNIPRRRGRLYLPIPIVGNSANASILPTQTQIDKAMALAPILADLGGTEVDWVVFSRAANAAYPVSNYWVDNEWDVQRSRGLRATTRAQGTVGE